MIQFFRRIRQKRLSENRLGKYLLYAIGEIVLVVIGILIALSINNSNEKRKKKEQFTIALEQIYNDIDVEIQDMSITRDHFDVQLGYVDRLLTTPDSIPLDLLPFYVFYVDRGSYLFERQNSRTVTLSPSAFLDLKDIEQLKVEKKVRSYLENRFLGSVALQNSLADRLMSYDIPRPNVTFGLTANDNFSGVDRNFYTPEERLRILELLKTVEFKVLLRNLKANRSALTQLTLTNTLQDAVSVQEVIKQYDPSIRLLYDDVGIIGTAIDGYDDVGAISTPMQLVDEEHSVWEIDIELKEGTVKFRTRDSWNQNWGGTTFPSGKASYYGKNIDVRPGRYRVRLNLTEKTYEFVPL